jgi:hypothetical protein
MFVSPRLVHISSRSSNMKGIWLLKVVGKVLYATVEKIAKKKCVEKLEAF